MRDCFFFFQAEDGIRDIGVTGVQTCALPICYFTRPSEDRMTLRLVAASPSLGLVAASPSLGSVVASPSLPEDPAPPGPGPCGLVRPFCEGPGLDPSSGSAVAAASDSRGADGASIAVAAARLLRGERNMGSSSGRLCRPWCW